MKVMKGTSAMPSPLPAGDANSPTETERFHLGTSDIDRYEGEDGDDADVEDEALEADGGLSRECGGLTA
jgi:hypothetical protein